MARKECRSEKPWQGENAVIKAASSHRPAYRSHRCKHWCVPTLDAVSIKASVYCMLVRERNTGIRNREFVMVWESHQFQWALKTELLVACYPIPVIHLLTTRTPEWFHPPLDTRADSFPRETMASNPHPLFESMNKHTPWIYFLLESHSFFLGACFLYFWDLLLSVPFCGFVGTSILLCDSYL